MGALAGRAPEAASAAPVPPGEGPRRLAGGAVPCGLPALSVCGIGPCRLAAVRSLSRPGRPRRAAGAETAAAVPGTTSGAAGPRAPSVQQADAEQSGEQEQEERRRKPLPTDQLSGGS